MIYSQQAISRPIHICRTIKLGIAPAIAVLRPANKTPFKGRARAMHMQVTGQQRYSPLLSVLTQHILLLWFLLAQIPQIGTRRISVPQQLVSFPAM